MTPTDPAALAAAAEAAEQEYQRQIDRNASDPRLFSGNLDWEEITESAFRAAALERPEGRTPEITAAMIDAGLLGWDTMYPLNAPDGKRRVVRRILVSALRAAPRSGDAPTNTKEPHP